MTRFYPLYNGPYDGALVRELMAGLHISELTARALIRRGVDSVAAGERFLHPGKEQLHDPFLLPDMDRAVERIQLAIARNEQICVYGDYDADGVCATAILLRCLRAMGAMAIPYIPARQDEGYGMNADAVRRLAGRYVKLIVTVDNGLSAYDEIALCRNLGVDVVITDHHATGASVPACCAVVSASRQDSAYPNRHICGAGVAFKLACALLPTADHRDDLALAAVATVADVVPLVGENRAIVSLGLPYVQAQRGLKALLKAAAYQDNAPDARTLAFLIAPRLNAAGRMADAMRGVELLLTQDQKRREALADALEADNTARKAVEAEICEQAVAMADLDARALIVAHEGWNPGVIGIVASRLCERYHRPAILFSEKDGVLVGSGRSPEGIDLYAVLSTLSAYFVRYGGHARAAGMTLLSESFSPFCKGFLAAMDGYDPGCFEPAYGYEEAISLSALSLDDVQELFALSPFGEGNPEAAYLIENAQLLGVSRMGKDGAHLSGTAREGGQELRFVAFRQGELLDRFRQGIPMDLLARPGVNRFRDRESLELYGEAGAVSAAYSKVFRAIMKELMYNGSCSDDTLARWLRLIRPFLSVLPDREAMARSFRTLRSALSDAPLTAEELMRTLPADTVNALIVFLELGFFKLDDAGSVAVMEGAPPKDLMESKLFRMLRNVEM